MNPKIEKPTTEREKNEAKIAALERKQEQLEHRQERKVNRQRYLSKKDRNRRTHHLRDVGGTAEHFFPIMKVLSREELYTVFEKFSELPEVQSLICSIHPKKGGEAQKSTISM